MIHYDTVNKILDLTRKFDKENMDVNELTAKMENILLSDGWKLKIANEPVVRYRIQKGGSPNATTV